MSGKMKVPPGDLRLMLLCTFRYSLGRQTYMPRTSQEFIKSYVKALTLPSDLLQIADEITEHVRTYGGSHALGSDFDQRDWYAFQEWCRLKAKEFGG